MNIWEILDIVVNFVSLVAILLSIYVFLTDRIRRWLFFGYKPTAMVIIKDDITHKVLIVKKDLIHGSTRGDIWGFPQGGIYSSNLNEAVNTIIDRELGWEPHLYEFEKVVVLGVKRISGRKVYSKYHFGSISLFPTLRGKGYIACVVHADLKMIVKKIKYGHGLGGIKVTSLAGAYKLIDPKKAIMLQKVENRI